MEHPAITSDHSKNKVLKTSTILAASFMHEFLLLPRTFPHDITVPILGQVLCCWRTE